MTFFSSQRERRLWIWTASLVGAIYLTLPLASLLAEFLYNQGIAAILFVAGMFFVALTILTQGLKTRPAGNEIGIWYGHRRGLRSGAVSLDLAQTQPFDRVRRGGRSCL